MHVYFHSRNACLPSYSSGLASIYYTQSYIQTLVFLRLKYFSGQVSDIRGDRVASQKLSHFIRERVAVILQQIVGLWAVE